MKDAEIWLALAGARLDGAAAVALIERFGSPVDVANAGAADLRRAGISQDAAKNIVSPDSKSIDAALEWLCQPDHHIISYACEDFPPLLREIADAPPLLYVVGDSSCLQLPALAVVGSRNPTRGGARNAYDFCAYLGDAGFCIVSGLAEGIDAAAHKGAVAANAKTIAFLGHGIDRIYPAKNRELAEQIADNGALATEYPLGSSPRKEHFPARNRLISGTAMGTLVVEAAKRSGSLITARLASEQGRDVFAIPGSIHNTLSRGCHQLIRDGAKLVENADDILSELGAIAGHLMQNAETTETTEQLRSDRDDEYKLLIKTLGHDPVSVNQLADKSGLTIDQVSSMLLILELEDEVEALNGGRYSLIRSSSWHERERNRCTDVPV